MPGGIDGTVPILFLPFQLDLGLVHTIALVGGFQVRVAALVAFRSVSLNPAPDTTSIDRQSSFGPQFRDIFIRQRIA